MGGGNERRGRWKGEEAGRTGIVEKELYTVVRKRV